MEKFLHFHLLISTIFSIFLLVLGNEKSFSPLNLSYIMEAKKNFMSFDITKLVDPPRPSYTFSIYNRDLFEKSKFKDYDSLLENRLARSQARAEHLASILENGNAIGANGTLTRRDNRNVPKTTSTQFLNGEYIAAFNLGSADNRIKRYLLVDTGSDLTWWQCGPCKEYKCYKQKNEPMYDLTKSSTYRLIDCRRESTKCLVKPNAYICSSFKNLCLYYHPYADGAVTQGWMAEELITFVLDKNSAKIVFGCGRNQVRGTEFSGDYSGIAGLGRGGYSLTSQFGADIMAICLPKFYSTKSSIISFHTTPFRKETSAKLIPNPAIPTLYFVNLVKILVNDKEVPLPRNIGNDFVDTGSTLTSFPPDLYKAFRDTFRAEARMPLFHTPFTHLDTCYSTKPGEIPVFPIVRMYFDNQDSENMLLLQNDQVVIHHVGLFCLAFASWDSPTTMIGSYQLQGTGLTFDTAANTLFFELDACW